MQMTSDLINEKIDRPAHFDMSCLGAASLAGLAVGMCGLYKKEPFLVSSCSVTKWQRASGKLCLPRYSYVDFWPTGRPLTSVISLTPILTTRKTELRAFQ